MFRGTQVLNLIKTGAVWLTSPVFAVEMMAAVIDRVQTAPASVHKNAIQESSGLGGFPNSHRMFLTNHKRNGRETRRNIVYLLFVCVFCVYNSVKAFWGRVEWYFQWLYVASVRKCVIFVTIPSENKIYLSVKRQEIYNTDDYIEIMTDFKWCKRDINENMYSSFGFEHNTEMYMRQYWVWFYIFTILLHCNVVTAMEKKKIIKEYKLIFFKCVSLFLYIWGHLMWVFFFFLTFFWITTSIKNSDFQTLFKIKNKKSLNPRNLSTGQGGFA